MDAFKVFLMIVLLVTFFGLIYCESGKIEVEKDTPSIRMPSGENVYRYEEEDNICFYTKFKIINCQER